MKLLCRVNVLQPLARKKVSARKNVSFGAARFWDGSGRVGARDDLKCVSGGICGDVEEWPKQEKKTRGGVFGVLYK